MTMTDRTRAELERRGASNIARMLTGAEAVGIGPAADVKLGLGDENPTRAEAEAWLLEKEREAEAASLARHREQVAVGEEGARWGRRAYYAALASILMALLGIVVPLWLDWLRGR